MKDEALESDLIGIVCTGYHNHRVFVFELIDVYVTVLNTKRPCT